MDDGYPATISVPLGQQLYTLPDLQNKKYATYYTRFLIVTPIQRPLFYITKLNLIVSLKK